MMKKLIPTTKPKKREYFWDLYKKYDFDKVMKIYNRKIFVTRVKRKFLMVWYVTRDFVKKRMFKSESYIFK